MSGTKSGGLKAKALNLQSDPDFYRRIGARGGAASRTGGFAAGAAGRRRARLYGAIGGSISIRGKVKYTPEQRARIRKRVEQRKVYQRLLAIHEAANK